MLRWQVSIRCALDHIFQEIWRRSRPLLLRRTSTIASSITSMQPTSVRVRVSSFITIADQVFRKGTSDSSNRGHSLQRTTPIILATPFDEFHWNARLLQLVDLSVGEPIVLNGVVDDRAVAIESADKSLL